MTHPLRFRQIHLDFHTSEAIDGIGADFNKKQWQQTLSDANVDSINIFAVCHHGWTYHDTKVGKRHPHLSFDLTRAMYDACNEIDVDTRIYISAGVNNQAFEVHPEWRCISQGGSYYGWAVKPTDPGFKQLCFDTGYLDYLCQEIQEAARLFPKTDGIWLDIINKPQCCCPSCMKSMNKLGLDAAVEADRQKHADLVLDNYYKRTLAALREVSPSMTIFQNSGHIQRGDRSFFKYVTHLELESLPTGGWGYDHFPMSAKYAAFSGLDFLGMTGKFHTSWGEFGGFKHPNALRYECAAMLAYGAKCCVGDQLHPRGRLDESTYKLIGEAYAEVKAKEAWCTDAINIADVGLLSSVSVAPGYPRQDLADAGASRMLLEGHVLFDIIDGEADFSTYKLLILPDDVIVNADLKTKLDAFTAAGGHLLLTGRSGLDAAGNAMFDIGGTMKGESPFSLGFILPVPELRSPSINSPLVVYGKSQRLEVTNGRSLGDIFELYFERSYKHFCSHQHASARPEASGYACGVSKGQVTYIPLPIFTAYRQYGAVAYKDFVIRCIRQILGGTIGFSGNLPSTARVSLTEQKDQARHILHLLYAPVIARGGGPFSPEGHERPATEVIEDLPPLVDIKLSLRLPGQVKRITLEPQGQTVPFHESNGRLELSLDRFSCHQMVVLHNSK